MLLSEKRCVTEADIENDTDHFHVNATQPLPWISLLLAKGTKIAKPKYRLMDYPFPSHLIWVSIKMLECNISLFFLKGPVARNLLNICGNASSRTFIIQILSQGFMWEGRTVPIKNRDLIFFSNIADCIIFRANFLSDCKESIVHDNREKWGGAGWTAFQQCNLLHTTWQAGRARDRLAGPSLLSLEGHPSLPFANGVVPKLYFLHLVI